MSRKRVYSRNRLRKTYQEKREVRVLCDRNTTFDYILNPSRFSGTSYKILVQSKDQTEISFTTTWTVGSSKVPLNVDKR